MTEYKLIDAEYASKDEAQIEITETKPVEVSKTNVSVKNILDTIAMLETRKAEAIAKFEAEIAINQEYLDQIQPLADTAKIAVIQIESVVGGEATTTQIIK